MIDRVGGTRPVPIDIRIIATSNRNLAETVREGSFREDLLFRLNVANLKIPPLRERPADVIELADYFVKKYAAVNGVAARPLSGEARSSIASATAPTRRMCSASQSARCATSSTNMPPMACQCRRPAAASRARRHNGSALPRRGGAV